MTFYSIRVRDDASRFYAHNRGEVIGTGMSKEAADAVLLATPNGGEWEVVPDGEVAS